MNGLPYFSVPTNLDIELTKEEEGFAEALGIAASSAVDKNGLHLLPLLQVQVIPAYAKAVLKQLHSDGYEVTKNGSKL
jgi:hypothetical protein